MIRQPTIVAFGLAAFLGVSLFLVKYDVQAKEEQLVKIGRQISTDQEAIHVLKAEWSFLTQPARLAELSERHLPLHPLTANQIGDFDQLALRADRPDAATPAEKDVPVADLLQAMQLAAYNPGADKAHPAKAAGKPRTVQ